MYVICGIPSNIMLSIVGARRWIAILMVVWGDSLHRHHVRHRPEQSLRAENAGGNCRNRLPPGLLLYLTFWFPAQYRARASACL